MLTIATMTVFNKPPQKPLPLR